MALVSMRIAFSIVDGSVLDAAAYNASISAGCGGSSALRLLSELPPFPDALTDGGVIVDVTEALSPGTQETFAPVS